MSKYISIIYCLVITITSCKNNPKIDKDLIYSTLNEIIQKDSIFARIVCYKFDQISLPAEIQKQFFPNNKAFIRKQLENSKEMTLDTGKLYYYSKKKNCFEKAFIDTTCSKNIFYHFTYPIFSRDLQTVVVGITEDCDCLLGGGGHKVVYRKVKGKWLKVKEFDRWIS